jgi:molybdopterin-guanine dinucleotide biosynthesis protein A
MDIGYFGTMAVIAGGKSSRMGFNKALLTIDGEMLTDRVIRQLSGEFREVIVSSNLGTGYLKHSVKYVADEFEGMGPLSGIYSSLKEAASRFVYVIACDMPYVNLEYIRYMKSRIVSANYDCDACFTACGDSSEPFNAFYSVSTIPVLRDFLISGRKRFNDFLKSINSLIISENEAKEFSPDWSMFKNINTPKELKELKEFMKE